MTEKKVRPVIALLLTMSILVCICGTAPTARASSGGISPCYVVISSIYAQLDISDNGYASGASDAQLRPAAASGKLVMRLQQYKNDDWVTIYSWTTTGGPLLLLEKGRYVVPGYDYRIEAEVTPYDSDGNVIEDVTLHSQISHY